MKAIYILLLAFTLSTSDKSTEFCDGWEDGYCQGWEYVKGPEFSICPIVPLCPMPKMFAEEYLDGYNRGFLKGRQDAKGQ